MDLSDQEMSEDQGEFLDYGTRRRVGRWVTLASYSDSASANLARQQLESEEIPCYVDNENTASVLWYMQSAVGGIKLMVPEELLEVAREVLTYASTGGDLTEDEDALLDLPADSTPASRILVCPHCHGTDVERISWTYRAMQATIIILTGTLLAYLHLWLVIAAAGCAAYFFVMKPDYRCLTCRQRWNRPPSRR
jgi:Putative prokaryotic signal transducing protein